MRINYWSEKNQNKRGFHCIWIWTYCWLQYIFKKEGSVPAILDQFNFLCSIIFLSLSDLHDLSGLKRAVLNW